MDQSAESGPGRRETASQQNEHRVDLDERPRIDEEEIEFIEERSTPPTPVIYEVVRRMGEDEMRRPLTSLWWSGVAAGLSLSFSLLGQAILYMYLPDTAWRPLVTSFGYTIGFLMVVLSRQQLFTENTITVVLPVMADFTLTSLWKLGRMWGLVLLANLVGTLVAALFCTFTPVLSADLHAAMLKVSQHVIGHGWFETCFRGITAGFLIAAMVWLLPAADTAQFHVIVLMTYLIAAGGFLHIIAGSMEAFFLVTNGDLGVGATLWQFMLPVLIGNVIGGTVLFALLSYGQVMKEL